MYFCSFVTKSNQAYIKYLPKCISQFLLVRHTWRVPRDFHNPPPTSLPLNTHISLFHYRSYYFCCLPIFSSLEPSKSPPKIYKISIGPENPPQTLFFRFIQNSLFGDSPNFSLHWKPPKCTCSLNILWCSSWWGIEHQN